MNGEQESQGSSTHCAVVIPAYQEQDGVAEVVSAVRSHGAAVYLIDDGSTDETAARAAAAGAEVLRHEKNKGKGAALQTGFEAARASGCEVLITMDGDGQHDPEDIPRFVEAYRRTGIPVLIGNRMTDVQTMPRIRILTNRFMSWLLSRTMGQYVPDTQCGYRLYRCDIIPHVATEAERFAAESEILVHIAKRGITIGSVPIRTIYGRQRSHINPIRDTVRFLRMVSRVRRASRRGRR